VTDNGNYVTVSNFILQSTGKVNNVTVSFYYFLSNENYVTIIFYGTMPTFDYKLLLHFLVPLS
jgi:hypothetical protein